MRLLAGEMLGAFGVLYRGFAIGSIGRVKVSDPSEWSKLPSLSPLAILRLLMLLRLGTTSLRNQASQIEFSPNGDNVTAREALEKDSSNSFWPRSMKT